MYMLVISYDYESTTAANTAQFHVVFDNLFTIVFSNSVYKFALLCFLSIISVGNWKMHRAKHVQNFSKKISTCVIKNTWAFLIERSFEICQNFALQVIAKRWHRFLQKICPSWILYYKRNQHKNLHLNFLRVYISDGKTFEDISFKTLFSFCMIILSLCWYFEIEQELAAQ